MQDLTILVNRYQICQELSHKAGRRTFLAQDLQTEQSVIVKMLQFDQAFQWDELKLFEREVKTLKNLNHPAIPQYLDYFEWELENTHCLVLVQTYIDAPSLETVIQEGRKFSEAEVMELAEGLLDILTYLHGQIPPVIHRDIKPSNILLTNRSGNSIGNIYLIDFGSVQALASNESGTITIVGSYGYIPLEQFSGKTNPASDLYSLGMTLIYLVTGIHPATLTQENGQVKFNSDGISSQFSRWLEKMTRPYLDRRFDSAKSALTALKSEDGSYGYYLNLRPVDSQVKLHRERDKLEIITEEVNYPFYSPIGCLSFLIIVVTLLVINMFVGVQFWPFWIFFLFITIMCLLCAWHDYYYQIISIERNKDISLGKGHNLSKPILWQKSSPAENINLLSYNPGYTFDRFLDATGKQHQRGKVTIPPKLSIYVGNIEYPVGNAQLTQAEYWWLAQELSDFLDLEIKIIYPTPKVPPEPSCGGC